MITTSAASTSSLDLAKAIQSASSQNRWLFFMYMLCFIASGVLTFCLWRSGNKVQDAVIADANEKTAVAQQTAGEANERSKTLESDNLKLKTDLTTEQGKVAQLQVDAANAKAAQQNVELQLQQSKLATANALASADTAHKEAARANEKADKERITRIRLAETVMPRRFALSSRSLEELSLFPGTRVVIHVINNEEAIDLSLQIKHMLHDVLRWQVLRIESFQPLPEGVAALYPIPNGAVRWDKTPTSRAAQVLSFALADSKIKSSASPSSQELEPEVVLIESARNRSLTMTRK